MSKKTRTTAMALVLALSLMLTGTVASAWQPEQGEASEDMDMLMRAPVAGMDVSAVIGDDADEDGFGGDSVKSPEGWSNFYYIHVTGATLRPRDSSSGWDYSGVGCVQLANGSELLNIHLDIPNGSRIDYLRMFFYDTSSNNSTAWVTNYNGSGSFTDLVSVNSTGNAGYGSQLSPLLEHVVNNSSRSYALNWRANQTGGSMRLCGLRVAYRMPT
jgi:hypothetical protein